MKKSRLIIVSSAFIAVLTLSAMGVLASANEKDDQDFNNRGSRKWGQYFKTGKLGQDKKLALEERMKALNKAFETGDYNTWLEAVGKDSPIAQKINQENFPKLVEIHNLEQQLKEKRKELGIDKWNFHERGQ